MKQFLMALAGLILITACGSQAKQTEVQKGVTLSANQDLTCKGAAFQGNEWYSKGAVWSEVDFVNFTQPINVERSGVNYCRNETGQVVTLTVKDPKSGATKSFETSADHFYFEITDAGKIVGDGITEVKVEVLGKFDVEVTTTSRNELYIKYASDDDKEILFTKGRVFNSTSGVTLAGLAPGVIKILVCFNEAGTETCNNVVVGGKMDPQNRIYLKTVQTNFDPFKLMNYVEENKEQSLVAELMADGSFSAPVKVQEVDFGTTSNPTTTPTQACAGIQTTGACANGNGVQHLGYTSDVASWNQSAEYIFRMSGTPESVTLVNDSTRATGTVARVDLSGQVSSNPDQIHYRQLRAPINALTIGQRYEIDYCLWSSSGGFMGVELHQSSGTPGQPWPNGGIYVTVTLPPSTWVCDGWSFLATLNTQQFYNLHIAGLSGTLLADDLRVR